MTTKLTLTVEESVINSAKQYARKRGRSLSNLVENYLKSLSGNESTKKAISPKVKSLMGVVKLSENYDYKKEIRHAIQKKHGK